MKLSETPIGKELIVSSIHGGRNLNRRLLTIGVAPTRALTIVRRDKKSPVVIKLQGSHFSTGREIAEKIMVATIPLHEINT